MRQKTAIIAVLSAGFAASAIGQDASWGDGDASVFNTPMGYASHGDINGGPKGLTKGGKRKPTVADKRLSNRCTYTIDGVTFGIGTHARIDHAQGFPRHPCNTSTSWFPLYINQAFETELTVETGGTLNAGGRNDRREDDAGHPAALNGGIDLD